eukprot:1843219-Amphidinium_carterae.1
MHASFLSYKLLWYVSGPDPRRGVRLPAELLATYCSAAIWSESSWHTERLLRTPVLLLTSALCGSGSDGLLLAKFRGPLLRPLEK